MEMQKNQLDTLDYYKDQIFKMLGLFESKDQNGYKFSLKILHEMEKLPCRYTKLNEGHQWDVVLNKVDNLVDEMLFLDESNHWLVKNFVFESINLIDDIREWLE